MLAALDADRARGFREAALRFPRTRAALSGISALVDDFLMPARAAHLVDDVGAYDVFLTTLFILVVDDHFDETMGTPTSGHLVDHYVARLLGGEAADLPGRVLTGLLEQLSLHAGWARFGELFVDELATMIHGMAHESKERGGFAPAPSSLKSTWPMPVGLWVLASAWRQCSSSSTTLRWPNPSRYSATRIGLRRAWRASATTFVRESVNAASPSQAC